MSKKRKKSGQSSADRQAAKREAVLGTEKKKRSFLIPAIVCAVLVVGGVALFLDRIADKASSSALATEVTFPVERFADGRVRHYEYKAGDGITIKYFVLKSSDGVIRAAFDACDVCWPSGKGYYQDGDYMVCRNCGRRFASVNVNVLQGGCNPAPLKRKVVDGKLVIEVEEILEGRRYFDFARGV
jgi:uncharacterized membrane protein